MQKFACYDLGIKIKAKIYKILLKNKHNRMSSLVARYEWKYGKNRYGYKYIYINSKK